MNQPFLNPQERNTLARLLVQLEQAGFRVLHNTLSTTQQTGISPAAGLLATSYLSLAEASDLILRLEQSHGAAGDPTHHPLAHLLQQCVQLRDNQSQLIQRISARLIVKYGLVADPSYLQELRFRYGIGQAAAGTVLRPAFAPQISRKLIQPLESKDGDRGAEWVKLADLESALYFGKAVGKIIGSKKGSGFLIGPDLFMTNYHVFRQRVPGDTSDIQPMDWQSVQVYFEYMDALFGATAQSDFTFTIATIEANSNRLDYAIFRLSESPLARLPFGNPTQMLPMQLNKAGLHQGYIGLGAALDAAKDDRAHIIQHPAGNPLTFAMNRNRVLFITDNRVYYNTDTKEGSSGSPVFNTVWWLIGLHRGPTEVDKDDVSLAARLDAAGIVRAGHANGMLLYHANEAVPIKAIVKDLRQQGKDALIR